MKMAICALTKKTSSGIVVGTNTAGWGPEVRAIEPHAFLCLFPGFRATGSRGVMIVPVKSQSQFSRYPTPTVSRESEGSCGSVGMGGHYKRYCLSGLSGRARW